MIKIIINKFNQESIESKKLILKYNKPVVISNTTGLKYM